MTVVPAARFASSDGTASHRFAEKRRWIARSSRSDVPCRYASIRWPVPVVRSGSGRLAFVVGTSLSRNIVAPPFVGLRLLTWEFASLDGYASCGEVLGEQLRLCRLA